MSTPGSVLVSANADGYNINNHCGALHPEAVADVVRKTGADVGIAFDGDADRVIFCDAQGNLVDGDRILAMCALDFKRRGLLARNTLVVTTMSNIGLHEAAREAGIEVLTTDVGDRLVIDQMRKTGATVGGEKSGHVILMDYATTGDGIIAALHVLRLMKQQGSPLADLARCMHEYPNHLASITVRTRKPIESVPALQRMIDACHADLGQNGRLVVRYSGTEPKIRILVEAKEQAMVDRWIATLTRTVEQELAS